MTDYDPEAVTSGTVSASMPPTVSAPTASVSMPSSVKKEVEAPLSQFGFRTVPRHIEELSSVGVEYTREQRKVMIGKDLTLLHKSATIGINQRFKTMGDTSFADIYDLNSRILSVEQKLRRFSLKDVFDILTKFGPNGNIEHDGTPIDFFKSYRDLSMTQIRASNKFYHLYGTNEHHQDLLWSGQLLENSIAVGDGLTDRINGKLEDVPLIEQGGPLIFKILLELITSLTHQTAATLVTRMRILTMQDDLLPGENIDLVVSYLRGALNRLKICNHVPPDICSIINDVLITAQTEEFNTTFVTIRSLMLVTPDLYDTEKLFDLAGTLYKTLLTQGKWCASTRQKSPKQSVFQANANAHITCHKCGQKGHYAPECQETGDSPPKKARSAHRNRIAPKEGELETRPTSGPGGIPYKDDEGKDIDEYWCKHCRSWNRTHVSVAHRAKVVNNGAVASTDAVPTVVAAATSTVPPSGVNSTTPTPPVACIAGVATLSAAANLKQLLGHGTKSE
jgi:hypothetical protein